MYWKQVYDYDIRLMPILIWKDTLNSITYESLKLRNCGLDKRGQYRYIDYSARKYIYFKIGVRKVSHNVDLYNKQNLSMTQF